MGIIDVIKKFFRNKIWKTSLDYEKPSTYKEMMKEWKESPLYKEFERGERPTVHTPSYRRHTMSSRRRRSIAQKRTWARTDLTECPNCGDSFNAGHYKNICPYCRYDLKTGTIHEKPIPLRHAAGKGVQANIYGAFIMVIAAMCCFVIPPIFALPTFTYMAIGLFFAAGYVLFPGQRQVLSSLAPGEPLVAKGALLFVKSVLKIAAFGFIIFQFWMFNRLVSLILGFLFYFTLPTTYKTTRPWRMIEAWIRMGLGGYLAFVFWFTFGPMTPVGNSLLWMGLAFFTTFPVQIEGDEEGARAVVKIELKGKWGKFEKGFGYLDKILFFIFMLVGLFAFTVPYGGFIPNFSDVNVLMFFSVWGLSLFVGLSAGPAARPPIGVIMILVSLFVFASTYTGYIGQAIFGYWWPQVQSFTEAYIGPLGNLWKEAQSGLSDTWLIITNPQQYYLLMQQKQQATKSVITRGGTPMSIEIAKFDLMPSIMGTLEPSEPVIGNMELHNRGDFISSTIDLDFVAVWVDAIEMEEHTTGVVDNLYCSHSPSKHPEPNDTFSPGDIAYCHWTGETYPTEMRSITFKLKEHGWAIPDTGADLDDDCQVFDAATGNTSNCTCFTPGCVENITYTHGGTTVKVNANLTYDYVVNVSIPIDVIGFDLYLKKLQAGEIVLHDLTSEYTGGPVKATLWTPKQPARTDIPFLVVASIYNDGSGELLEIKDFTITVFGGDVIKGVDFIGTTFRRSAPAPDAPPDGCDSSFTPDGDGNFYITCHNTWPPEGIKPGEWKRVSFYIDPINTTTDQRTTQIVGWADYKYRKTTSQRLVVANAPPQ